MRKDDPRVEAYGGVDELNAVLGIALTQIEHEDIRGMLATIQESLFDLGSELATPSPEDREAKGKPMPRVSDADVEEIEGWIDRLDTELEPLRTFVLPGGAPGAAHLHHARTVCRRAERRVVGFGAQGVGDVPIRYLNRLSDLLFTIARVVNRRSGVREPTWEGRKR